METRAADELRRATAVTSMKEAPRARRHRVRCPRDPPHLGRVGNALPRCGRLALRRIFRWRGAVEVQPTRHLRGAHGQPLPCAVDGGARPRVGSPRTRGAAVGIVVQLIGGVARARAAADGRRARRRASTPRCSRSSRRAACRRRRVRGCRMRACSRRAASRPGRRRTRRVLDAWADEWLDGAEAATSAGSGAAARITTATTPAPRAERVRGPPRRRYTRAPRFSRSARARARHEAGADRPWNSRLSWTAVAAACPTPSSAAAVIETLSAETGGADRPAARAERRLARGDARGRARARAPSRCACGRASRRSKPRAASPAATPRCARFSRKCCARGCCRARGTRGRCPARVGPWPRASCAPPPRCHVQRRAARARPNSPRRVVVRCPGRRRARRACGRAAATLDGASRRGGGARAPRYPGDADDDAAARELLQCAARHVLAVDRPRARAARRARRRAARPRRRRRRGVVSSRRRRTGAGRGAPPRAEPPTPRRQSCRARLEEAEDARRALARRSPPRRRRARARLSWRRCELVGVVVRVRDAWFADDVANQSWLREQYGHVSLRRFGPAARRARRGRALPARACATSRREDSAPSADRSRWTSARGFFWGRAVLLALRGRGE